MRLYFLDNKFLGKSAYKKTVEKAREKTEKREYWQTDDITWLSQKKEWRGLKTIILARSTIRGREGEMKIEKGYFISSLPLGIEEIAKAVCRLLDGRELPLAPRCNLSIGWEPYVRETGGL